MELDFRRRPIRRIIRSANQGVRELLALTLILCAPALVYAFVFGSPWFRLRNIRIEGNRRVPSDWIEAQVGPFREQNLLQVSRATIQERLLGNPWIGSVYIKKELPDRLHLIFSEKKPAALFAVGEKGFVFVDANGQAIAPIDGQVDPSKESLVAVLVSPSIGFSQTALLGALRVKAALAVMPEVASQVRFFECLDESSFRVVFRDLPFRVLIDADKAETQVRRLRAILPALLRRYDNLESIDLRFNGEAVLRLRSE